MGLYQGQYWVIDMQRVRTTPKHVEDLVRQVAQYDGRHVEVWLEQEGGSSGKTVTDDYRQRVLLGYAVYAWHPTGRKGERAKPVSSAAEAGNVFLLRGPWNGPFLEEVPAFGLPGVHDDVVDAMSGAFYALTQGGHIPQGLSLAPALAPEMLKRSLPDQGAWRPRHAPPRPPGAIEDWVRRRWSVDVDDYDDY